jgi:hypothetical protein
MLLICSWAAEAATRQPHSGRVGEAGLMIAAGVGRRGSSSGLSCTAAVSYVLEYYTVLLNKASETGVRLSVNNSKKRCRLLLLHFPPIGTVQSVIKYQQRQRCGC